ncbi:DnaJ C-terminal domain-containing protein [Neptunomonas sp.]|uniref:DnaJ C-terminal domain-containing protein n=1 Tax=Neptunomonas sp. TaxID=1971898 RepID=UPI003567D70A
MEYKDYYKILGVEREASAADIKRAYQKLARKYHPDVNKEKNSEERFKEVNEAYHALKDPKKRKAYDQLGANWHQGQTFQPPPGWTFQFTQSGMNQDDIASGGFSKFFDYIFGGKGDDLSAQMRNVRMRGQDLHATIHISLEDAFNGAKHTLTLAVPEQNEQGQIKQRTRQFTVHIPQGISEGQSVRLAGQGGVGIGDMPNGDLYLRIAFEPHPYFHALGHDIYLELPVTPWEAALGCQISTPTLSGPVMLTIPANAQAGLKLRLKGKGLPGRSAGDQYVILKIVNPPVDSEKTKVLYQQMASSLSFNPRHFAGV